MRADPVKKHFVIDLDCCRNKCNTTIVLWFAEIALCGYGGNNALGP